MRIYFFAMSWLGKNFTNRTKPTFGLALALSIVIQTEDFFLRKKEIGNVEGNHG